jgi:hypothetical protein
MPFRLDASRPGSVDVSCVDASGAHHASCVDTLRAHGTLAVELQCVQKLLISAVSTLPVGAVLTLRASLLPANMGPRFERRSSLSLQTLPTNSRETLYISG